MNGIFKSFFKPLNRFVLFTEYIGGLTNLALQTISLAFIPPLKMQRVIRQCKNIGVDSLPIVTLVAFFTGVVLALQTAYQMQKFSAEIYIASIVAVSLVRELGPVLTSLIVAGRNGAAITAEVGTMTVTEQVDALSTLATNPVKYLVVPRFLALIIMLPLLTVYSDFIGILGGHIICTTKLAIPSNLYFRITFDALALKDIFTGLLKTFFFGMAIAVIGCYEGFKVEGGAEGVGRSTTKSVVVTFVTIIAADCFFAALFYFILGT